jgi:hypothetical protein
MRRLAVLVALLLFAGAPVSAQYAHDVTTVTSHNAGTQNIDVAAFTVANNDSTIVVGVCLFDAGSGDPRVTSVALDLTGTAFAEGHAHQQSPDTDHNVYQWYLAGVSSGSHQVRVVKTATAPNAGVIVSVFSGGATSSPLDGTGASANGTSTTPASGTLASQTQSDSLVVATLLTESTSASATVTQGTNYTIPTNGSRTDGSGGIPVCGQEYRLNPGGTSNNPGFTSDNVGWAEIGNAYKIAGGAAPVRSSLTLVGVGK